MKLNVSELGPLVKGNSITFRLVLPNLDKEARVLVTGSFCDWELEDAITLRYNSKTETWEGTIDGIEDGEYEYGFVVKTGSWYSNVASDPYARMSGENGFSSFVVPTEKPARLDHFRRPRLQDLILYELEIDNFNFDLDGVRKRVVHYLSQLGINGIVFSPWCAADIAQGERVPISFFAPDAMYGSPYDLKVMINECHRAGIAVIMDIDMHAVSPQFGFAQMYPMFENKPMLGRLDDTGKRIYLNYTDEFAQNFAYEVCRWWLDEYNVDGIRFLNVSEYWDGPSGDGFGKLCREIFDHKKREGESIYIFTKDSGRADTQILNNTATNGVENRYLLQHVYRMAESRNLNPDFWKTMDLNQLHFTEENTIGEDKIRNAVLNFIEDGEHHSLIVKMGVVTGERNALGYPVGDRKNHWWKVKPYVIAQFTAAGIPVIFNGQEISNNRFVPDMGPDRYVTQPIGWHYLQDFAGKDMFRFHQKLILLRNKFKSLRSWNYFHDFTDLEHQLLVYKRYLDDEAIVVGINFSNESYEVPIPFPSDGIWHEYLDDYEIPVSDRTAVVKIPARYGVVFYKK